MFALVLSNIILTNITRQRQCPNSPYDTIELQFSGCLIAGKFVLSQYKKKYTNKMAIFPSWKNFYSRILKANLS